MFTILQSLFPYFFREVWVASWKVWKCPKSAFWYYVIARRTQKKVKFKISLWLNVVHTVANSCAKYHLKITFLYWDIAASKCIVVENAHCQKKPFKVNVKKTTRSLSIHKVLTLIYAYFLIHSLFMRQSELRWIIFTEKISILHGI